MPGVSLRDGQYAAGHADPRMTRSCDRGRFNHDRHPTYAVAASLGYPPKQASMKRPVLMASALGFLFSGPRLGLDTKIASHACCTCVPGCSGNVVPGAPRSASAAGARTAENARVAAVAVRRRLIAKPPLSNCDERNLNPLLVGCKSLARASCPSKSSVQSPCRLRLSARAGDKDGNVVTMPSRSCGPT
jgi:hypothetical protein